MDQVAVDKSSYLAVSTPSVSDSGGSTPFNPELFKFKYEPRKAGSSDSLAVRTPTQKVVKEGTFGGNDLFKNAPFASTLFGGSPGEKSADAAYEGPKGPLAIRTPNTGVFKGVPFASALFKDSPSGGLFDFGGKNVFDSPVAKAAEGVSEEIGGEVDLSGGLEVKESPVVEYEIDDTFLIEDEVNAEVQEEVRVESPIMHYRAENIETPHVNTRIDDSMQSLFHESPTRGDASFAFRDLDARFQSLVNITTGDMSITRDVNMMQEEIESDGGEISDILSHESQNILPGILKALNPPREWSLITSLDLSSQGITSVRDLEANLPNLKKLVLDDNALSYFKGVPEGVLHLSVVGNRLSNRTCFEALRNLHYLDISGNGVSDLLGLKCLVHLRELRAARNGISGNVDAFVWREFEWCLQVLDLSGNQIKSIGFEAGIPGL
jgi:hypothetical protein